MTIVVAPDSFKGSLTAIQAAEMMKKAILAVQPQKEVIKKPMADGGEGTTDSLLSATPGDMVSIDCTGPLGQQKSTSYAIIGGDTAVIECAKIAGLADVPLSKRNPDYTTTYGIEEVMLDALDKGCTSMIVGLGGSATNDGGLGMLLALGMGAFDIYGDPVGIYGADVTNVANVDISGLDPRFKGIHIKVASDVTNPLCGEEGASAIYGPQKGATKAQIITYDRALKNFSYQIESALDDTFQNISGAGAAGGLGFGLLTLGAELVSGATLLGEAMDVEGAIAKADFVLTGEGQSDVQTLYGKAPGYVASLAKKHQIPIILISGSIKDNDELSRMFSGSFSMINKPLTLDQCMLKAETLLYEQTKQIIQLLVATNNL